MRGRNGTTSRVREVQVGRAARPAITCKPDALKALFAREGINSYEGIAAELDYRGLGGISRALNGEPVSSWFIAAVRLRFPEIPYERLFTEGTVTTNATADAAA